MSKNQGLIPTTPLCLSSAFNLAVGVYVALGSWSLGFAAQPPEVHMLIPGFTVEEIPVQLPNINNLRFAPDGSLTALGYNGKVWKLRDTDGDGMEDSVSEWWNKAPLTVPVGMCWSTHGLFVSSSGKVSLLKDTDSDDIADTEEVVASGWPDKDVASGNVDATGVTMDSDGNLYFGLLTANYANAYRLKKVKELSEEEREWLVKKKREIPSDPEEQVSLYDVNGMRGSVQKWSAVTRELETIATGVRVPYNFGFNKAGDLFMTDQEGETWMPNGNPLDELNHIIPGRNYGFPPRHATWLPDVRNEAPIVSFGPQHQSACGFIFNEPQSGRIEAPTGQSARPISPGQGLFGPKIWQGDAIVAGQSRGKIWRVPLEKTESGYNGESILIARLSMLTTDVAISPNGDLYVSCHSGMPDWGTGPAGQGKIFRIRYTDSEASQPIDVAAVSPTNVEVTFDRPIDPKIFGAQGMATIKYGNAVRAADRFEVLKPPYNIVAQQEAAPRGELRITNKQLSDGGRTIVLTTDQHLKGKYYALRLSGIQTNGRDGSVSEVDLSYDTLAPKFNDWPNGPELVEEEETKVAFAIGDYESGRSLFLSERLKCATCHQIRGEGAGHAADLSNLVSRDAASVLRDIEQPSATINPDYVGYNVVLNNDEELTGFVRHEGNNRIKITSATGEESVRNPTDIAEMRPAGVSLMPEGLLENLDGSQVNDLLTFLLHEPPQRTEADVEQIVGMPVSDLAGAAGSDSEMPIRRSALRIVLVASEQDHGHGQHDYPAWQKSWHQLLSKTPNTAIEDAWLWPSASQFKLADAIIFYFWNHDWDDAKYAELDAFQARGGGIVVLHSATIEDNAPLKLAERIGLAAQPQTVKYRHMPFDLQIVDPDHEITTGLPSNLKFLDEPYWPMIGDRSKIHILANARNIDEKDRPMMWTYQAKGGRVFASIAGHYTWTLDDPVFRLIILRGLDWVTRSERFSQMAVQ